MNEDQLFKAFQDAVEVNFAFLEKERGYRRLKETADHRAGVIEIVFTGRYTGFEFLLEPREGAIDCKLCILDHGTPPLSYAVDDNGERVREGVVSLVRRRGVRETLFTTVTGKTLQERIPITIADFGRIVRNNTQYLLDDPAVLR